MVDVRYPIGELKVPEKVTLEQVQKWLKDIETFPIRLRETVGVLNEEELNKTYREGSWTVRQLVHHIADAQVHMYIRLKLALTDDNPDVAVFDENIWAVLPDTDLSVESSIKIIEGLNERIVSLGKSLTEKQINRTYNHPINGKTAVGAEFAKLYWHEEHHLTHIRIALS